jgi:acid stress-induced BolA-like protein IbaG/YrbA
MVDRILYEMERTPRRSLSLIAGGCGARRTAMTSVDRIKTSILGALRGANVTVEDTTGSGDHFSVVVVASQFEGKTRVEQHQLVYAPLRRELEGAIHALALRTFTPAAWEREREA